MKHLKLIVSCLIGCAATALPAQTYLGTVYTGFNSSVEIPVTVYNSGTLAKIEVVTGGASNLDFTYTGSGSCQVGSPVTAGTPCTIGVKFAPTMVGARYGAYLLTKQDGTFIGGGYLLGNGTGPQMSFLPGTPTTVGTGYYSPSGLAVDEAGNLYSGEGSFSVGEGAPAQGYVMKNAVPYTTAPWNSSPKGIAVDGGGLIYTSNATGSYVLYTPDMSVSAVPIAGHAAVDAWGNLYTACATGVCKETLQNDSSYVETTLAHGMTPTSIAVDGNGNVFVAAGAVYKFAPVGKYYQQTTAVGATLGVVTVAVDGPGNLYLGDSAGHVYKNTLQPNGGYVKSTLISAGVYTGSLAADGAGDLYYFQSAGADAQGNATYSITKQSYTTAPALTFATTVKGALNAGGAQTVTITNSGSLPLQFTGLTFPADFIEASTSAKECTAATTLVPAASCTLTVRFAPVSDVAEGHSVQLNEQIVITSNQGNQAGSQQTIALTGTEVTPVAAPVLSLPAGVYYTKQVVTLSTTAPGATMYYTLNGTTPTTASRKVTGPIAINAAETLMAIAVVPGVDPSAVTSAYYALTAPTPVIAPTGATYNGTQMVTITTPTPIQAIFYTTTGNNPTSSSKVYSGPIPVGASGYVTAFAAQTGFLSSPIVRAQFTILPAVQ